MVLHPKHEISNEEEDKGDIGGVGPSNTRILEEELGDLKGGKENSNREAINKTYASKHILEPKKNVMLYVSSQEYASTTTKMGE